MEYFSSLRLLLITRAQPYWRISSVTNECHRHQKEDAFGCERKTQAKLTRIYASKREQV